MNPLARLCVSVWLFGQLGAGVAAPAGKPADREASGTAGVARQVPGGASVLLAWPRRPRGSDPVVDLFAPSLAPAPTAAELSRPAPAPEPAVQPPVPVAPALPFKFLGRYADAATDLVLLTKGEQLYVVAVGDTIEGMYRIERVSGGSVEIRYLPLQVKQSLMTGDPG